MDAQFITSVPVKGGATKGNVARRLGLPATLGLLCLVLLLLLAPLLLVGCQAEADERTGNGPHIVATTGQVADLLRQVGGEDVTVTQLMGAGVDPHLFQPREADIRALDRADAVFYNGLRLEGRLGEVLERMSQRKPVVAVAQRLPREKLLADEEDGGEFDPHVWFDPALWQHAVDVVAEELAGLVPERAEAFAKRAEAYQAEIAEAHQRMRAEVAGIPRQQRVMITAHDAFQYFGRAFDIDVMGIQGISTESDAGQRHIEQLVSLIVQRRIPAVFVETSVNPRHVEALVEGAAAQGHEVDVGVALYSDAMGEPGTPTGTYLGMLEHNVTAIAKALGSTQ